jgi:hypothetical protein
MTLRLCLLATLAAGCATDDAPAPDAVVDTGLSAARCGGASMSLDVGSSEVAFEPVADGAQVQLVHGPQGGWHLDVAGAVTGAGQEVAIMPRVLATTRGDLQVAGDQQPDFIALAGYDDDRCAGEFFGVRAYIDDVGTAPDGLTYLEFVCSLAGEALLEVTVEDIATGVSVTESVSVTLLSDPADDCP